MNKKGRVFSGGHYGINVNERKSPHLVELFNSKFKEEEEEEEDYSNIEFIGATIIKNSAYFETLTLTVNILNGMYVASVDVDISETTSSQGTGSAEPIPPFLNLPKVIIDSNEYSFSNDTLKFDIKTFRDLNNSTSSLIITLKNSAGGIIAVYNAVVPIEGTYD